MSPHARRDNVYWHFENIRYLVERLRCSQVIDTAMAARKSALQSYRAATTWRRVELINREKAKIEDVPKYWGSAPAALRLSRPTFDASFSTPLSSSWILSSLALDDPDWLITWWLGRSMCCCAEGIEFGEYSGWDPWCSTKSLVVRSGWHCFRKFSRTRTLVPMAKWGYTDRIQHGDS